MSTSTPAKPSTWVGLVLLATVVVTIAATIVMNGNSTVSSVHSIAFVPVGDNNGHYTVPLLSEVPALRVSAAKTSKESLAALIVDPAIRDALTATDETQVVLIAAIGQSDTLSTEISIKSIQQTGNTVTVSVDRRSFEVGSLEISAAVHVIRILRADIDPRGDIIFQMKEGDKLLGVVSAVIEP